MGAHTIPREPRPSKVDCAVPVAYSVYESHRIAVRAWQTTRGLRSASEAVREMIAAAHRTAPPRDGGSPAPVASGEHRGGASFTETGPNPGA